MSECLDANTVLELIEGRLDAAATAAVESHVAGCGDCRQLVVAAARAGSAAVARTPNTAHMTTAAAAGTSATGAPAPARGGPLVSGECVDRYVVLMPHGRGGMGDVYQAYDPELDRRVALKLLRVDAGKSDGDSSEARGRMLREARALAKLAHPNVVAVYDAGTFGDQVFLTMELVSGRTLRRWLAEDKPSWRRIVGAFLEAGRGLAAVHAAGLVHRDVKPDNIIVGDDGRVRVLDFGLARVDTDAGPLGDPLDPSAAPSPSPSPGSLTAAGAVVGTLPYMSPEQRRGLPVDDRADQFSFCVSLYEALYGERPFVDDAAAAAARVRPPRRDRDVPAWLRALVLRGLAAEPDARFPSIDALLAALGRDPGAHRRTIAAAALLVGIGVAAVAWPHGGAAPCGGGAHELDGIWDPAVRDHLARALAGAGNAIGEQVTTRIDDYARDWIAMHREACEAARVRGEQSAAVLDARMGCLERRRRVLRSVVELLAAGVESGEGAADAAGHLPAMGECADVDVLMSPVPLPPDPMTRARVDALQDGLARVEALRVAGRFQDGLAAAEVLAAAAGEVDFLPVRAEADFHLGALAGLLGDGAAAERWGEQAVMTALAGRHPQIAIRAAIDLVWVIGIDLDRRPEGRRWGRIAEAEITAMGGNDRYSMLLENALGSLELQDDHYDAARTRLEHALQLSRTAGDEVEDVAPLLVNLGLVHYYQGRYAEAAKLLEEGLAIFRKRLRPDHPVIGQTAGNLANLYLEMGQTDRAAEEARLAYDLAVAAYGPDNVRVSESVLFLGVVAEQRGEYDVAERELRRALALRQAGLGADSNDAAEVLAALGELAIARGDPAAAVPQLERALAIADKAAPGSLVAAGACFHLSEALAGAGRHADALARAGEAVARFEKISGPDHPRVADGLVGLARRHLEAGQPAEAVQLAERALAIFDRVEAAPHRRARAELTLAQALWATPAERPRALALAGRARAGFVAAGPLAASDLSDTDAWLALANAH